jgi:LAO/AO transport system kinase
VTLSRRPGPATIADVPDLTDLVSRAREGSPRAVAQLVSMVEDGGPAVRELAAALAPHAGHALVVGLTGSPGVGKSTTTSALVSELRSSGRRVGVLAVDPSSPFSGGALLGDRVRMSEHATDPGVFIRSMATRGHLGGLSAAAPQALRVLDAAGCDVVLVETVGVGQSEVEVVALADTTVVLLAPGMGDGIQATKAGILEIADVFCVNKADREGADTTIREIENAMAMGRRGTGPQWRAPVVRTVASAGRGIDDLLAAIDAHRAWMAEHGRADEGRRRRARAEIEAIALADLRAQLRAVSGSAALDSLAAEVAGGDLDPFTAAERLRSAALDDRG